MLQNNMTRNRLPFRILLITAVLASTAGIAIAQSGRGGFGPGSRNFPSVGSTLPEVTVYDDQGKEFSTRQLRGQFSVLVFGCLT